VDVDARLEAVEAENEMLRERISKLEEMLGITLLAPLEFGLTGHEAGVFGVLMAREIATKDMVMAAVYRSLSKDEAEIKIVDVFICKIRKKLRPFDIVIDTVWGQGYRIAPLMKDKIRSMFEVGKVAA
jgi:two-component system cell cycle response regulator CtrA